MSLVSFCSSGKDKKEYSGMKFIIIGDVTKPTEPR